MGKSIFLKKLTLKNFKGIKDLEIDFYKVTNIYGANATGKTTIFDAFTWLMFDKDSQDRVVGDKEANFQIKTIDKDGNVLHGLQHEVCGILNVDGNDIELRKIYKEKWSKKRGATEKTISTHTVDYIIDDVPLRQKDYKKKVSEIIDDKLFKLITSVLYFSMNMKKEDRRKVLVEITGNIEDSNVINKNSSLQPLLNLLGNKTIEELKISIQAKKRKLNDDIKTIPIRIDEANNSIKDIEEKLEKPDTVKNTFQELKDRKSKLEFQLEEVNGELSYKEQNEKLNVRIKSLKDKEKKLGKQIAALEGKEFLCEEFIKTKVELLETSINSKFKYVSFKLFDIQVNGGLIDTCEALIDGIPFSNANTASQINTGIDIINALSKHYGVQASIFIDNRESVNNLIETSSQVINLIVSKDKNLNVEVR